MIPRLFRVVLFVVACPFYSQSATFTVTSLADTTATGTLRWAINSANSSTPPHTISFTLPSPFRIAPASQLPTITNRNILITGTNQPGYAGSPIVTLSGTGLVAASSYGLVLAGNGITVQGIVVERFSSFASEGIFITGSTNRIESCLIRSNYIGISMWSPARQAVITRNTISHNPNAGIRAVSSGGGHAVGWNSIVFNGYGLDWSSPNSDIGGFFGSGNVIGANTNHGLYINQASATNINVFGNFIGVDATGTNAMGNGQSGVYLAAANGNTIGGNDATYRNIIAANGRHGIHVGGTTNRNNWIGNNYIGVDANAVPLGNGIVTGSGSGIHMEDTIGAYIFLNVIGGNRGHGIGIYGASSYSNRIDRNVIGVNFSGNPVSNRLSGVFIGGGSNTLIGTAGSIFRNVISGNGDYGVEISGATNLAHVIANNYIGTDTAGTVMRSNGRGGIRIHNGQTIQIGDPAGGFAPGNIISGNALNGILVEGTNTRALSIQNNLIGVDVTGTNMLNNTANGIFIAGG
ncbi:MAG TPA: right-handed parallel beta-helix repeat-containing protein, partial [Kiritimatiellia bacterium]|nr:right-handed parallel beta-helix repeat-containing protein [Kiritimatiellia bacterium]